MSKRKDMLTDPAYRRTPGCTKYAQMLDTKAIPPFPIKRLKGKELSLKLLQVDGLHEPLIVDDNFRTLGMKVPDANTTLTDVARIIKPDFKIKFIEVGEQEEVRRVACILGTGSPLDATVWPFEHHSPLPVPPARRWTGTRLASTPTTSRSTRRTTRRST